MGIAIIPAAGGGGIKLVQRGQATSAGNTTITAIDTTKAFIRSFSEGASGTVATNSIVFAISNSAGKMYSGSTDAGTGEGLSQGSNGQWSRALGGGTMDATTKQMGAYIVNSTTITATGACRWEVVEFA
jgi:hypothetical protein